MKKFSFLLFICMLLSHIVFSQLDKNSWIVGGSGSFISGTYNPDQITNIKNTNFQLSATIGYFLLQRFPVGLRTTFQIEKQYYNDASGTTSTINGNYFIAGPFVRYYFLKHTEHMVNVFAEANYSFGTAKPDIYTNRYQLQRYSFLAGPVIYFNRSVGLEFTVGYFNDKPTDGRSATSGFQTILGFQVHFNKK